MTDLYQLSMLVAAESVTPELHVEPPIAPGSDSSRRGAKKIDPHRNNLYRKIILELGASSAPLSREGLSSRLGVKESTLCGRLDEMKHVYVTVEEDVCLSTAGVSVNGYSLTKAGRDVLLELEDLQQRGAA